ncbi:kinase-like domain-containing protein [Rhodofomes roseus]|uniref:non-specific serine/threonine protein kinase n=1 Tax=Rhodofomes roseus TaxID=34475 RepID=A0ABQ8K1R4_9APHY|nr:kinase-like domain-containing protein [Rhodofomes roseus]KAH9830618.1 kinase-like domain-containing protein [Rhodofomes roseus]
MHQFGQAALSATSNFSARTACVNQATFKPQALKMSFKYLLTSKLFRASSVKVDHKPRAIGHETPESSLFKTCDECATVMHDDLPSLTQNAVKSDDVRVQLSFNGDGDVLLELQGSFKDTEHFFLITVHPLGILREQHFLHGDIKPANLLVNDDNHLVLADFGLARDFGRPWGPLPWKQFQRAFDVKHPDHAAFRSLGLDGWDVTRRRNCGTQNDGVHSYEADVWSAGVTIYEMLTGWMSFGRDDNTPTADWYLAPVVVPLTFDEQKDTLVNDDARDLLRKMLEVDPIKRVTIEEIKEHTYFQSIDWKQIVARVPIMGDHTATHSPDMKQKPARIPYAPPYKAYEDLYSWFEWVSPALNRCTEDHHGDDAPDNPVTDTFLCFGDDHEHPTPCISRNVFVFVPQE